MRLLTLLSAAKQGAGKLADEIGRSAAMAAAALLVAAHECVHGKAPESASPVAGGAVDAARAGNCVGCWRILRFGVGVCGVGGRAAVRAATADGRLARGQIPLRHAGADLDVVVFARRVVPLRDPSGRQLGQRRVGRARVGRDGRDGRGVGGHGGGVGGVVVLREGRLAASAGHPGTTRRANRRALYQPGDPSTMT